MSRSLWSGNRPKDDDEAKVRLRRAALEVIRRSGFAKSTMSEIARQAGVARPTLYKHFGSKLEVFFSAIDAEALGFAQTVVEHARRFETLEERICETIVHVVRELPRHRYLSMVLDSDCGEVLRGRAFSDDATLIFSKMTAAPLVEIRPDLEEEGVEISEIMARFAMSIIEFPGRYSTDHDGLRRLIRRRLLPGLV